MPLRPVHRLDEPAGLSLSMVASPQCRFCFARQDHCSAAATSGSNFRTHRDPTGLIRRRGKRDHRQTLAAARRSPE